jgi:hypothetical protein
MNRKARRSWKWLRLDSNHLKLRYLLTPEDNNTCIFRLGRIKITSLGLSIDGEHSHKLTTSSQGPTRNPNALLVILLCWAKNKTVIEPYNLNMLYGDVFIDPDREETKKAIVALIKFATAIDDALTAIKTIENRTPFPTTLRQFSNYTDACKRAEIWYGILQDWAIQKPGGVLLSRLNS